MIREEIISRLVKGKKVLDIGSLGQSDEYCLWHTLTKHCRDLTGVDLPDAEQSALKKIGIHPEGLQHKNDSRIIFGNMESLDLKTTFDVIIAGDVIEHVSNQGIFLDNVYRHLTEYGILVITTPNAKWPTVFLRPNITHTLWHDLYTLRQILERHNFKIQNYCYYFGNKPHYSPWKKLILLRQQILAVAIKNTNLASK